MTGFWLAEEAVEFAAPRTEKRVHGQDIAKTVARKATEAERWRYGVELRITGSRWRQQTLAPHYPEPKPYVYQKRSHSLAWAASDHNADIDDDYRAWLAERDRKAEEITMKTPTPPPARDYMAEYEANAERVAATNVVPFAVVAGDKPGPTLDDRRRDAASLLRELAAGYGPRRAHKLRAMADFLETAPARRKVGG